MTAPHLSSLCAGPQALIEAEGWGWSLGRSAGCEEYDAYVHTREPRDCASAEGPTPELALHAAFVAACAKHLRAQLKEVA